MISFPISQCTSEIRKLFFFFQELPHFVNQINKVELQQSFVHWATEKKREQKEEEKNNFFMSNQSISIRKFLLSKVFFAPDYYMYWQNWRGKYIWSIVFPGLHNHHWQHRSSPSETNIKEIKSISHPKTKSSVTWYPKVFYYLIWMKAMRH